LSGLFSSSSGAVPDAGGATILDADLRAFLETLPQIVWRTTPDGLSDYFNRCWYEFSGLSAEASLGDRWSGAIHPDDAARAAAAWQAAVREEATYDVEFRLRGAGGAYRWFLARATPLRDPAGRIVHWYGTCTDIDAQKRVEVQFRAIAEAIPQMVFTALPDGTMEYLNAHVYEYTGIPRDPAGWSLPAVVHPDDLAPMFDPWRRSVKSGDPYEAEARLLRADGAYRWFIVRASALRDPASGSLTRWFGTCTDVDDLHGAATRDAFLSRADELFAAELDPKTIVRAVARASVESFADYVFFDLAGEDGQLRRAAVEHRNPRRRERLQRSLGELAPPDHPIRPVSTAWRSGESVLVPRIDASWWRRAAMDDSHYERMRREELASLITVVITSRGRRFGVLSFCRAGASQSYGDFELTTAEELARRVGAALENAHLYQEARAAAEAQRDIAEREAFYARLGEEVAETLHLRETLDTATRLLVPSFADWAVVNLIDQDDALFLASSHHRDPALDARTRDLLDLRYLAAEAHGGSPEVVRTKQPVIYEQVPQGGIGAVTGPYREAIRALGVTSAVIVPIAFGGAVRGTIAIMYDRTSERHYSQADLPFFVEVARRLSPAIGNAEAYERARRVAWTFQAAALTMELPRVAGISFDALYEPSRSEALIGGDWYDAFRVADGRIVLTIGDVAGSGLDAAATMAAIRQSLRGAAAINPDPSVMLDAADRVLRWQAPDRFVTAWVGVLDPVWATLKTAGAGHPPPLERRADGSVLQLPAGGLPLGLRERGGDVTRQHVLAPNTTLLLYTDGLIEAGRDVIAGEAAVALALREADIETAPARAIHQAVLDGVVASDDVALLVVGFRDSLFALGGERGAQRWTFDVDDGAAATQARSAMVEVLERRGVAELERTIAELIFAELIGNVKRYAPGCVDVALDLSGTFGVLHVVDSGEGFQHNARLPADALDERGRGLFIVATIAEEFAVTRVPDGGAHARAVLPGRLDAIPEPGYSVARA
jgi:PAS domain S-box-containing protein